MADYKGIWCVAETRKGKLLPTAFELLTAARKIAASRSEPVTAVVLGGPGTAAAAAPLAERGADKVLVLEHASLADFVDEAYAGALKALAAKENPRTLLLPATVFGRSLAPRLAVALRAGLVGDGIGLELDAQGRLVVERCCYAGNVIAGVTVRRAPEMATLRPMAFPRSGPSGKKGEVVSVPVDPSAWTQASEYAGFLPDESGEIDVAGAEKIVSGGRGLGKAEGFEDVRKLAKALGAAVGASRAAVDAGWIPYKHQVGLTGRSVRPRLYVACGISGQIQHLAGMNGADTIIAINTDAEAPMMKLATYALQGDLHKVLPALVEEIQRARA